MAIKNKNTEQSYTGELLLFSPGDIVHDKKRDGALLRIVKYDYEHTFKVYNYDIQVIDWGSSDKLKPQGGDKSIIYEVSIETAHSNFKLCTDPTILVLYGE